MLQKNTMILYTLLATLVLITAADEYNCTQDADCVLKSELHNFACLETECERKQCNCPVGQVIHSDNSTGIPNHYCVPHIPLGQACSDDPFSGSCNIHRSIICINSICQCSNSWKSYTYTHWHYGREEICMAGYQYPAGEIRFIGARCSVDSDCSFFPNFTCVDNKCKCSIAGQEPNLDGTECKPPLQHGEICTTYETAQHCDGTKGLVCGDICNITTRDYSVSTCQCDPSYRESGSSCVRATVGTSCNRDYQCKSLSRIATCESGSCAIAPGSGCLTDHDCIFVSPTAVCVVAGHTGTCQTGRGQSSSHPTTSESTLMPCAGGSSCHSGAARERMDVVLTLGLILVKRVLY